MFIFGIFICGFHLLNSWLSSSFVLFNFFICGVSISSFVLSSIFVCDFELLHLYFFYLCFLISLFVIFESKCLGITGFFGFWEPLQIFQTSHSSINRFSDSENPDYFFGFFGINSEISESSEISEKLWIFIFFSLLICEIFHYIKNLLHVTSKWVF